MVKIFVSYARDDEKHKERFITHLESLNLHGADHHAISDGDINAGAKWRQWLDREMKDSDIGVLLLSPDFLSSEYCKYEAEALSRELPDGQVVPILVRDCAWEDVPQLAELNLANREPVSAAADPDTAWKRIAARIRRPYREAYARTNRGTSGPIVGSLAAETGESKHLLADALREGGGVFTPLLGPGTHEPENLERALDHVKERLERLLQTLSDSEARIYTEAVVEANLTGVKVHSTRGEGSTEPWAGDFVTFQAALSELGARANSVFVKAMIEEHIPVIDIRALKVPIKDRDAAIQLRRLFFAATRKATELLEKNPVLRQESARGGLGAPGIREQLVALTWIVFRPQLGDQRDDECQEWIDGVGGAVFNDVVNKMKLPYDRRQEYPILALAHVEWLGDLLWHTFRFEAPIYPNPAELAFQISVCSRQFTPPRREAVGTVASVANLKNLVDRIESWLKRYSSKTTANGGCYRDLASALCHKPPAQPPGVGSGSSAEAINKHEVLWPIAITTNFDNDLEQVLSRAQKSFHVIFPVYIQRGEELVGTDWMLRGEMWVDGELDPLEWQVLGDSSLTDLVETFEGPLIVKLHGSPLTRIRDRSVRDSGGQRMTGYQFVHRLIISDIDFFREMVSEMRSWPNGLTDILYRSRRTLCFLGYSLADVNNRLRLYDQVYRREQRRTDRVFVIDHPEDPIYAGFLKRMEATPVAMTLNDVIRLIRESCDPL